MEGDISYEATNNWTPLGLLYYRKILMYELEWTPTVDLSFYQVVCSPCGGPIAVVNTKATNASLIFVFSSSGALIGKVHHGSSKLLAFFFTMAGQLITVFIDSIVSEWRIDGTKVQEFSLGGTALHSVRHVNHHEGTTLVALTVSYSLVIRRIEGNPFETSVKLPLLTSPPYCWGCYYSREFDCCNTIMCFESDSGSLVLMENNVIKKRKIETTFEFSNFFLISISFNQRNVALVSDTSWLWLGSVDLTVTLMEVNINLINTPSSIEWCGDSSVLCVCDGYMVLYGPENDNVKYYVDSTVVLVQEVDGVRIISQTKHEFLQEICESLVGVYLDGNNPGATLLDAYREYKNKSYKSVEYIQGMKGGLPTAVTTAIKAASEEWDPKLQRMLLKASCFGRTLTQVQDPDAFYKQCQFLRILNNFRRREIAVPMSSKQYHQFPLSVHIERLLTRKLFSFSYEVCRLVGDSDGMNRCLSAWVYDKIRNTKKPDEELATDIIDKLTLHPGVSFSSVTAAAIDLKRTDLAVKLLEADPNPDTQVPMLLQIGKIDVATKKALASGEPNILYAVILYMHKNLPSIEFLLRVKTNIFVSNVAVKYMQIFEPELLMLFYKQDDNVKSMVSHTIRQLADKSPLEKRDVLQNLLNGIGQKNTMNAIIKKSIDLFEAQRMLENTKSHKVYVMGLSLIETISNLCENDLLNEAFKLKTNFAVPDNRFYWAALSGLAKAKNWSQVNNLYEERKFVLPLKAYVNVLLDNGAPTGEVEKYILKMSIDSRHMFFIKAGSLVKAAESAMACRKDAAINQVLDLCKPGVDDKVIKYLTSSRT